MPARLERIRWWSRQAARDRRHSGGTRSRKKPHGQLEECPHWRHLGKLGDLLANESQSSSRRISVAWPARRLRCRLGKLTFEYGFTNLSAFRRQAGTRCQTDSPSAECLNTYREWVGKRDAANIPAFRIASALSLEYQENRGYTLTLPDYATTYTSATSHSLIGTFRYGRNLLAGGAKSPLRVDISASYQDVSGDPQRNNRFVATAHIHGAVSDGFQVPVGVVYANKTEYLGQPDKPVSAHLGFFSSTGVMSVGAIASRSAVRTTRLPGILVLNVRRSKCPQHSPYLRFPQGRFLSRDVGEIYFRDTLGRKVPRCKPFLGVPVISSLSVQWLARMRDRWGRAVATKRHTPKWAQEQQF